VDEMKLQILDEGLDSNEDGEHSISFFNELDTETRTMLNNPGSVPRPLFHFLMSLTIETGTMLITSVSFFNEVSTNTQNYPHNRFHFLTSLKSEKCSKMVSFFNELEIRKPRSWLVSFFNDLEIRKPCSTDSS
jgi:hypothetical protein